MFAVLTIIFCILALFGAIVAIVTEEGSFFVAFFLCLIVCLCCGAESVKVISVTNTVTPGTVIKTPNAVIAEIRVGDRIERAIFTDISTYQHATPQTRIIWRETETSWGKTGVIVLDLP